MKRLLMMRTRGLSGSLFRKHANCGCLSKSTGNAYSAKIKADPSPAVTFNGEVVTHNGEEVTHG